MNEQMNILLEVLEEIKQQNRELKASITNLVSQPNPATRSSEDDAISLMDVHRDRVCQGGAQGGSKGASPRELGRL